MVNIRILEPPPQDERMSWNMLFDSEAFVVVHIPVTRYVSLEHSGILVPLTVPGYEIVDKRTNTEVFVIGESATYITDQIDIWRESPPEQSDVDLFFDRWSRLGQIPLLRH